MIFTPPAETSSLDSGGRLLGRIAYKNTPEALGASSEAGGSILVPVPTNLNGFSEYMSRESFRLNAAMASSISAFDFPALNKSKRIFFSHSARNFGRSVCISSAFAASLPIDQNRFPIMLNNKQEKTARGDKSLSLICAVDPVMAAKNSICAIDRTYTADDAGFPNVAATAFLEIQIACSVEFLERLTASRYRSPILFAVFSEYLRFTVNMDRLQYSQSSLIPTGAVRTAIKNANQAPQFGSCGTSILASPTKARTSRENLAAQKPLSQGEFS